ncbi:nucleoporin 88 [Battus philenor]|uniref:nucleoporin 88 n=1 Tax=Battus philenor TaxID=42288 RepID=UPI0035CE9A43
MDTKLYDTILVKHNIFKDIKESLLESTNGKLYNLMELKDDVLYIWNSVENCLFCVNINHLEEHPDETPYQKLHLVSPPAFNVERVTSSECGSRLCLWGARGVTIAELPSRWGRGGLFDSGNKTVLCKSYTLDERFLYSQGDVRRVQWHPGSLSHILVLLSDNTIRLYNIAQKSGPKLVKVIVIGPKPCSQLAGKTILDSLGDTAVDFTSLPGTDTLLILRGDGEVYMVQCSLDPKSPLQPKLSGPLPIYPPADDNYGSESCSICVMGSGETVVVVIATCSAALYHCVLLPAPSDKEKEMDDGYALYVIESVELNVTLNTEAVDMQMSYPVHLYPCTNDTYACMHVGGVHTVSLPVLDQLNNYLLADDAEAEGLVAAACSRSSSARHLVRWGRPGRGLLAVRGARPLLLLLCADGTLLTRNLEPYDLEEQLYKEIQIKNPHLEQDDLNNLLKEKQKLSFTSVVQEILSREASQPILKLDKKEEPSPAECLEVLTQATMRLRAEYMGRQRRAGDAMARKTTALCALAASLAAWRADFAQEIENVKAKSRELAAKRDLAEKHQDDLKYRCSAVVRAVRASCVPSGAERELLRELQQHRRDGDQLAAQLQQLKDLVRHKNDELKKWHEEYKKKETALGKSHSDTISSILQQQTAQISFLIEETKLMKDQLSIV